MLQTKTWLTETDELARELDAPDLVIIDASWHMPDEGKDAHAEYLAEHIPGALFFDIDEIADTKSSLPHMLPPPEKFSSRMRSMGIGDGSRIVIYDSAGSVQRRAGVVDVPRDGRGRRERAQWRTAEMEGGGPADRKRRAHRAAPRATSRRGATLDLVRDVSDIKALLKDKSAEIVDARAPERFAGQGARAASRLALGAYSRRAQPCLTASCSIRTARSNRRPSSSGSSPKPASISPSPW